MKDVKTKPYFDGVDELIIGDTKYKDYMHAAYHNELMVYDIITLRRELEIANLEINEIREE